MEYWTTEHIFQLTHWGLKNLVGDIFIIAIQIPLI